MLSLDFIYANNLYKPLGMGIDFLHQLPIYHKLPCTLRPGSAFVLKYPKHMVKSHNARLRGSNIVSLYFAMKNIINYSLLSLDKIFPNILAET
jgi:hypothetical protein